MLLFERPPKPSDFEERMEGRRREVEASVAAGEDLSFDDGAWRAYKSLFAKAQSRKCGFCESDALKTGVGTVEHFRPKGEISVLVEEGRERLGAASNVEGRIVKTIRSPGYWRLAYDWNNWLLACERCNTGWKRTLFPVVEESGPRPPSADDTALLLNPFEKTKPGAHLKFDDLGQISAVKGSREGVETIRTLGLVRETLRGPRQRIVKRILRFIRQFLMDLEEGREPKSSAEEILWHGGVEAEHAGMVRIVFEQQVPMTWSELVEIYGDPP